MAKDLPYFKFFCSEWNDGDITLENYEIQGLFINICSYYWSKECNVTKKLISKRFRGQEKNIEYLLDEGFIKYNNEHLYIKFLNEQFAEVESSSNSKSLAGIKSAKLRKLRKEINELLKDYSLEFKEDITQLQQEFNTASTDVDFLLQQISTIKIRGDKRREDKDDILGDKKPKDKDVSLKDEEEVKPKAITIYSESDFLKNWATCRKRFLNKPTHIEKLEFHEKKYFDNALKDFSKEQINTALLGLFKQKNKNIGSMYLKPKHFLENISKYLNAEMSKDYELYGKDESLKSKTGGL